MFEVFADPAAWAALGTLTILEIVLGIDNIVFISILSERLGPEDRKKAWYMGLGGAAVSRIGLLLAISWIISLNEPWFEILGQEMTGRSVILLIGGIFLVYKATKEIHAKLEGEDDEGKAAKAAPTLAATVVQIILLDVIFSLDSVITAVGMTDYIEVMFISVLAALALMITLGRRISEFVLKHPTVKMLALSFLLLIGVSLGAEAFHAAIPKGYIYAAMAFSVFVEMLNLFSTGRKKKKRKDPTPPVPLRRNVVGIDLAKEKSS